MRNVIEALFRHTFYATWAVPSSGHNTYFRMNQVEDGGWQFFMLVPFGPKMVYATDFYTERRLNAESYYTGVVTGNRVNFSTVEGLKAMDGRVWV
jgi:hypothetical protein